MTETGSRDNPPSQGPRTGGKDIDQGDGWGINGQNQCKSCVKKTQNTTNARREGVNNKERGSRGAGGGFLRVTREAKL